MQKESRYRELLAQQQESGLTIKEFCSNQSIAIAPFHYWKKKLCKKAGRKDFIPLVVKTGTSLRSTGKGHDPLALQPGLENKALFELVYPNGTLLRITSDLDLSRLRTLIHLYD